MTLSGVYGFWKLVSKLERRETRRYLEMFYILKFRELVSAFLLIFSYNQLYMWFKYVLSINMSVIAAVENAMDIS